MPGSGASSDSTPDGGTLIGGSRLLLHAGGSIASALDDIAEHLEGVRTAVFLPYALHDHDAYTATVRDRFAGIGIDVVGLHTMRDAGAAVTEAGAIIVGGGNTFRLVRALHDLGLLAPLRAAVAAGAPYFGASAGTNVACPSMRTTNDMPVVQPPSFETLGLVPFQINPHYADPPPPELRIGETRDERIREFLEENDVPVLGLREESWLIVRDARMTLGGMGGAVLFRRSASPEQLGGGADLTFLLGERARFDVAE